MKVSSNVNQRYSHLEVAAGALAQKEVKTCTLCLSQRHKHVSLEFLVSELSAKGRADIEGCLDLN